MKNIDVELISEWIIKNRALLSARIGVINPFYKRNS